ncbi:hypothetical protein [Cellulosilyticum sp. I15G10I2]|uniref:hypothetical protein n=1 Tax=Cellulosilyticum sp. I15G10I2 TaxID=1892843 RepID=UPI00085C7205|nr:hypothetical protein [Cellulosilyticum sp. I15G10I2]
MTGKTRNDSIIRTLLIIIMGTIAFNLLFNIFIGGGSNMGEHYVNNMGGTAFSIDLFLSGLLVLLVKLLLGVLVIAVIIGVIMWIKETFFKNTSIRSINTNVLKSVNDDPILKAVAGITVAILGTVIVFALLQYFLNPSMRYGAGYNMGINSGMGYSVGINGSMGYGMGSLNPMLGVAALLPLLIQILSFVLVVALILAVVAYLKKQYDAGIFNSQRSVNNEVNTSSPILISEDNKEE